MSTVALVLVLIGLAAISIDLHVTLHGALAALGTALIIVGLVWLAALTLSPLGALLIGVGLAIFAVRVGEPAFRGWRDLLNRPPAPEFSSEVARAVEDLRPTGFVRVDGMLWRAISVSGTAEAGQAVRILVRRGLSLMVLPLTPQEASALTGFA